MPAPENSHRSAQSPKSTSTKRSTPTSRVFSSPCKRRFRSLRMEAPSLLNASIVSSTGPPAFSVYSASKAAVRSFARTFTTDLKDRNIRVNAVSPGVIPSPGYRNSLGMTEEQIKEYADSVTDKIPLGRTGTLDEIAKVVSFLASDESSYVTGIELFVDGGMTQI